MNIWIYVAGGIIYKKGIKLSKIWTVWLLSTKEWQHGLDGSTKILIQLKLESSSREFPPFTISKQLIASLFIIRIYILYIDNVNFLYIIRLSSITCNVTYTSSLITCYNRLNHTRCKSTFIAKVNTLSKCHQRDSLVFKRSQYSHI